MTSFPEFRIRVTAVHLDLFHDDWYGHPLPWMTATFAYLPPEEGYSLFSHLIGSVFSIADDPRPSSHAIYPVRKSRKHVYILLAPPPTFNQPVVLAKAGKGSLVSGLVAGMGIGASLAKTNDRSTLGKIVDLGQLVYAAFKQVLVLRFSLKDFWLDGTTCRLLTRFQVKATFEGLCLCQFLAGAASKNLWALYKPEKMKTVEVQVTGVNFFNGRYPVLKGIVTEGVFSTEVNDVPVTLELVPDPFLIPSYIRTVRAARKVRWVKTLGKFLLQAIQVGLEIYDIKNKQNKATGGGGAGDELFGNL
ncbi:dense granule protein gra12 [Cystoisospora suis]|uniref:Dense granule protein gra12 n=1 Tax=Cystoisospora suis TaxID=483139 RepID=A0A2C6KG50_9APIC|nr:dense granule protein gra12 [Cystoisospora suis]